MKKFICLILSVLLAVAAVGCKSRRRPQVSDDYEVNLHPDANVSATLRVATTNFDGEKKIISDIGALLKKKYPNVKVKIEPFSGAISTQYASWYNAGDVPDILINNTFDMFTLSDKGILLNLDPYLDAEKKDAESDFDINDYYEAYFKMGQDKFDGAQYMIPRSADRVVCHYNKAIFEAAGVDMTKVRNGWTWDDMLAACAKLRTWLDANGMSGVYCLEPNLTSWLSTSVPMLATFGNDVISESGKNVIAEAGTAETLNLLREMVEKRYIPDSQTTVGSGFEQGSCAMYFQSMAISQLANKKVFWKDGKFDAGKLDLVTFPLIGVGEEGAKDYSKAKIGAGIAGYCISRTSSNKSLAWAFLRYLLSKGGQQEMALNGLNLASIRKDLTDPKTANWGKGYDALNLEAYTWGSEYKMSPEFFQYTKIGAKKGIDTAIKELFVDGTNMKVTVDKAISNCKNAIDVAISSAQ